VMSLSDNSGSAWGTTTSSMGTMHVAEIANLTGVLTGKVAQEGYIGVFGDRLEVFPVERKDAIFATVDKISKAGQGVGGGTENGIWLFWDKAIREREHWDHVFVYSDMQAGHGGLYGTNSKAYRDYIWRGSSNSIDVPKLIATYRQQVNPNVMVYLVQVAGYTDTIVPEFYDRTYILGGWGEGLLRFAAQMAGLYRSVKAV
jgi:60 kDa SS-A/Ro ribonucleoprotein